MMYEDEAHASFAKEAMANQSLDMDEILNVRWVHVSAHDPKERVGPDVLDGRLKIPIQEKRLPNNDESKKRARKLSLVCWMKSSSRRLRHYAH